MSKKNVCPEQCRDCKWHDCITGLVHDDLHLCTYAYVKYAGHCAACVETTRRNRGMCPLHEKEDSDAD